MTSTISYGAKLREMREAKGMTPEELGERAGIHGQIIRKLETGESKWPRFDTAIKIARALGVSLRKFEELVA